ncbi:MAG: RHS repeat protein, partial [Hymenobacter sp.]
HDPQQPDGYQVFNLRERLTYYFAPVAATTSEPAFCLLQAVSNAHGQSLQFTYTEQGYLQGIKDSAQRALEVLTDATGRIIAINLPLPEGVSGTFAAVQYTYDELGNMTAAIDAEGYAARYDYEGNLLVRKTFREGTSFYFEYDAQARCTRTWGDENYYNGSFFYAEGHTVLLNEEPSARHEYFHQNGLVTRYIDPVGAIHEWYYNQYNELELARDPLGQTTTYDYDARGNQVGISYSAGTRVGLNYDAHNLLVAATDITGGTWKWEHDEQGNLLRAQNPAGAVTEYTYDQTGRLVTITDALNHATHLRYDSQQNVAHIVTPDGHIRSRTYDALGRSVILTDALGYQQHRRYDRLGRLVALQEPDGRQVSLVYDGEGNVVRAQDGQQEVEFAYTAVKRLARRRQAGQEIQFTYDREGRLVQLINEHNLPYRFTLDAAGRVVAEEG